MTTVGINGAAGRMGRRLIALAHDDPGLRVTAALEREASELLGQDAGLLAGVGPLSVPLSTTMADRPDVLIDFSVPAATRSALALCRRQKVALVIGTTGLTAEDHAAIDEAAAEIAVLQAPNMSLGVNVLFALAAQVAALLGDAYDIEITEAHHRFKKDAPSGTAIGLAQAICAATGKSYEHDVVHGRCGDETTRKPGAIGMHALRMGDVVGEHTAAFAAPGERIELRHVASTRDVFAHGALRAARWLAGKAPGRYAMTDVLGLKSGQSG